MSSRECLRCEMKYDEKFMLRWEGCWVCPKCKEYIEKEYPNEMLKEFNHLTQKCRGCE